MFTSFAKYFWRMLLSREKVVVCFLVDEERCSKKDSFVVAEKRFISFLK